MLYGYNGRIMRVNLSQKSISVERPEEAFYRTYYGGWAFVAYYLLKELEPGIDPLGPENKLIVALGPVTGMPLGGSGRNAIGAKSPLTSGLYRHLRHPRYLGVQAAALGLALLFRSWIGLGLNVPLLAVLLFRIRDEEALLRETFGPEWDAYCQHSWRLIPHLY